MMFAIRSLRCPLLQRSVEKVAVVETSGNNGLKSSTEPMQNSSSKFSTTTAAQHIMKMTRLRVVDNSAIGKQAMLEGKPPKCIHVYKKTAVGTIGDKVMVAIKGEKKKAYIVGVVQKQSHMVPKMDSNNIVLIDDNGSPLGTRILVPIPFLLRGMKGDMAKIIAIATKFV